MKNLLTKILSISLLLSAAIPSDARASVFTGTSARFAKISNKLGDYSNLAGEKSGKILSNLAEYRNNAIKTIISFLDKKPEFKYAGAAVVFAGILYGLDRKFDLAAKVEKKAKEAWNNKWVRYTAYGTGTVLAATALYVGLASKGYLPRLSMDDLQRMIKSCNPWDNSAKKEAAAEKTEVENAQLEALVRRSKIVEIMEEELNQGEKKEEAEEAAVLKAAQESAKKVANEAFYKESPKNK